MHKLKMKSYVFCVSIILGSFEACRIRHPNWCTLPTQQQNNPSLTINCGTAASIQLHPTATEDFVEELTLATCDSDSKQNGQYQSLCLNGQWTIPPSECVESCRTLPQLENVDIAKCHINSQEIECEKTNPIGTILEPRCELNTFANRENAICTANGRWSVPKLKCEECGKNFNSAEYGHQIVEIHSSNIRGIGCFGTFISPYLVITDADCMRKEFSVLKQQYSKIYSLIQLGFNSKYEEREIIKIHYPDDSENGNNRSDIAILEIKGYLLWHTNISIPCLDWNKTLFIDENTDLLVPNIADNGVNESKVFLPPLYANRSSCITVQADQQCVKYRNGGSIPNHWKGCGVFVENHGKYYLKGVTGSAFSETNYETAVITDLSKHLDWIRNITSATELRRRSPPLYKESWVNSLDPPQKIIRAQKNDVSYYENLTIDCSTTGEIQRKFVDGCILPNKNIYNVDYKTIGCQGNTFEGYCSHSKEGEPVPQNTSLEYKCAEGFASYLSETSSSTCFNGVWTPPITRCGRICETLESNNVTPKCTYEGREVDCQKNLIANTKVDPVSCVPTHRMNDVPKYSSIYCREDGKWSGTLPQCPVCGQSSKITKISPTLEEEDVHVGELPWHAVVYNKMRKNSPFCAATIVSPYTLISTVRCFYNSIMKRERYPKDFEIGVSKITSNRNQSDSQSTQFYELEDIIFNHNFRNSKLGFQGDIAILMTKDKISFNSYVSPVCLYGNTNAAIAEDTSMNVAIWNTDETGRNGNNLSLIHTSYINDTECNRLDPLGNLIYSRKDKFCMGGVKNVKMDKTDSGSGIVQYRSADSSYYLVGIVDLKVTSNSKIFYLGTSVSQYLPWIVTEIAGINHLKNYFQG